MITTTRTIAETNFLNAYYESFNELFKISERELLDFYREDTYGGYPHTPGGSAYDSEMKALYCMVRLSKPEKILEIGQWRGDSTNHILLAIEKNGFGEVHLVDIAENVIYENLHSRNFTRHLCDSIAFLSTVPELDFDFIAQDGCHQAHHVQRELQILKEKTTRDFHIWAHDYFAPVSAAVNVRPGWDAEKGDFSKFFPCVNREEVRLLQSEGHRVDVCGIVLAQFVQRDTGVK